METITPLEIQKKRFPTRFRGYDVGEVDEYLEMVSNEMGDTLRKNQQLKEEIERKNREIQGYLAGEETLKTALISAQRTIEEMKANAEKEAKLIVSQAQIDAEKILEDAHRRLRQLTDEINDLKLQKVRFETALRSEIELHLKILDARSQEDRRMPQEETRDPAKAEG